MTEPYHFGVVGGGMTGMYLSRLIAGMGNRVTLIEEMEHPHGATVHSSIFRAIYRPMIRSSHARITRYAHCSFHRCRRSIPE